MARGKLIQVDYNRFRDALSRAANAGSRVEKTAKDKPRWTEFIREHQVPEAACLVHAQSHAEKVTPVIIAGLDAEWDGFYMYSTDDEVALKYAIQPDA